MTPPVSAPSPKLKINEYSKDQGVLQNDLNDLAAWKGRWNMRFHSNKREILSITRALKSPDYRKNLFGERQGLQGIRQTRVDQTKCSEMDSAEISQDI